MDIYHNKSLTLPEQLFKLRQIFLQTCVMLSTEGSFAQSQHILTRQCINACQYCLLLSYMYINAAYTMHVAWNLAQKHYHLQVCKKVKNTGLHLPALINFANAHADATAASPNLVNKNAFKSYNSSHNTLFVWMPQGTPKIWILHVWLVRYRSVSH